MEQRIVGRLDAGHEAPGAERDLLGLGEEVRGVAVEGERADALHRAQLLGDDLGRVEQVDALEELVVAVGHHLHAEVPLRVRAGLDRVPEVAAVEVGVDAPELLRLLPDERVHARRRLPVELHEAGLALGVDQSERVDAEALHGAEGTRDRPVRHRPHQHVGRLGRERHEVPERVVGGLRLRDLAIGLGLRRVDHVGELDAVLDEEHGHVVADEVEVALLRVELRREAAHVTSGVGGTA